MPPAALSPCAIRSNDAARDVPEEPHPYRSAFQRDRDRILHCAAFRRLDFKSQVFVPHVNDHFRTRLTHSLEVAQIARDAARALRLNEDLVEAVALAHDLGHPPFGHGGEEELDRLMADCGGFEHNRQSLRVVEVLEHPYPDFRGLNLTRVTRECLAKHETRYDTPEGGTFPAGHAPLEGQLVNLCDEIAYTAADLDDALGAGWLRPTDLADLALWDQAAAATREKYPRAGAMHMQIRTTKRILAMMTDNLVAATAGAIRAAGVDSPQAVRDAADPCATFAEPTAGQVRQLQDFLCERVYRHPKNLQADREGQQMIRELFEVFLEHPDVLPERYERRIAEQGAHRVVCDYVAGMTDRFCRETHARLCG